VHSPTVGVPLWLFLVVTVAVTVGLIGVVRYFLNRRRHIAPPPVAEREREIDLSLLDTNLPYQTQVPLNPHTAPPPYTEWEQNPELATPQESLPYKTNVTPHLKL
jgi:hypothetical protein